MLNADDILLSRVEFDDFSTKIFEGALRGVEVKDRRNPRELTFLVSKNTYDLYVGALASRMGDKADSFLLSMVGAVTYAGASVVFDEEIPDGMVEVYGPQNKGLFA